MALSTYSADGITYSVADDDDLPVGSLPQAIVSALLVDEITGLAPAGPIEIDSSFAGLTPRTGTGGLVGLAGIPVRSLSMLASKDYHVDVQISADGYLDVSLLVTILHTPGFPSVFNRPPTVTVSLHRQPTTIYGRTVVNASGGITPAAGASITLTGLWRTLPPANAIVPPDPPDIVSLNPPLYTDRAAAITQLEGRAFLGAPGPDKRLLEDVLAGESVLPLSDCVLLAASAILAIDSDPAVTELISVKSIVKSGPDSLPATVTLDYPLRYGHRRNAVAHEVKFQPPGPPVSLTVDAIEGDSCAFVTAPGSLALPIVQISGGPDPIEYHQLSLFETVSDTGGFFRMPPLSRVAQCKLTAHDGVHSDVELIVCPDYSPEATRVDFVFQ